MMPDQFTRIANRPQARADIDVPPPQTWRYFAYVRQFAPEHRGLPSVFFAGVLMIEAARRDGTCSLDCSAGREPSAQAPPSPNEGSAVGRPRRRDRLPAGGGRMGGACLAGWAP